MPLVVGEEALSVGIPTCDGHHKNLFAIINEFYDAMKAGKGSVVLGPILDRLLQYTNTHFSAEEAKMMQHGYPNYSQHKLAHEDLIRQLKDFKEKVAQGQIGTTIPVLNFLQGWLTNHIKGVDKQYRAFFEAKGVK